MLQYSAIALLGGFILDCLIGDPRWLYHPVRIIGLLISACEKVLRKVFPDTEKGLLHGGVVLVIIVCIASFFVPLIIIYICLSIHKMLGIAVMIFMSYQMLATKSLKDESMKVYEALRDGTIEDGRKAVSMIVGRDTQSLDERGVIKATVETIAENFSDGVFAPMLYLIIGGPAFMFLYKGINTMDSMIGYKNDKYIYFGRVAAKLDDVANYIPARLAALAFIVASAICKLNARNSLKIWKRDRRNHASPNSAQTEAAVAGALDIQLAGNAYYFGELYEKPYIGDDNKPIVKEHIKIVNNLMMVTATLSVVVCCGLRIAIYFII